MAKMGGFITVKFTDGEFEVLEETLTRKENNVFRGSLSVYYVDRRALCFPILLDFLRGYPLRKSLIDKIRRESCCSDDEFFQILYSDAKFYGYKKFYTQIQEYIYRNCPSALPHPQDAEALIPKGELNGSRADALSQMRVLYDAITSDYMVELTEDDRYRDLMDRADMLDEDSPLYEIREVVRGLEQAKQYYYGQCMTREMVKKTKSAVGGIIDKQLNINCKDEINKINYNITDRDSWVVSRGINIIQAVPFLWLILQMAIAIYISFQRQYGGKK